MQHFTLFELNQLIRQTLDANLEPSYWVAAEIGELRMNQKGHCYLELVEKEEEKVVAKQRSTIWAYTYRNLSPWFETMTGQSLKPGIKILCNVVVQFHELYGLSLNIRDIDANYTLGERAKKRQEVIDQLKEEGVFNMNKMLELPLVPQNIAIISSPSAAGFGDFMHQIQHNSFGYTFHIRLFKAIMQGEEAVASIVNALHRVHHLSDQFDLLVIIRGGGSQIDLDCFDIYELATHVAQFPLPVITGIGHERDETITDLVAHTKMKTPTAVAELLINGMRNFEFNVETIFKSIANRTTQYLQQEGLRLQKFIYQLRSVSHSRIMQQDQKAAALHQGMKHASAQYFREAERKIYLLENSLELLNPQNVLSRGYAIASHKNKMLKDTGKLKKGDIIQIETLDHRITSKFESAEKKKP